MNMIEKADQALFEKKVIKKILPKYRRAYNAPYAVTKHVDTLERLGNLEYYSSMVGGYKATAPLTLGAILNSLDKTVIRTALVKFLKEHDIVSGFDFIIDISSSTALYVLVARDDFDVDTFCSGCRFSANLPLKIDVGIHIPLVMLRLDDYLDNIFPNSEDDD